MAAGSGATPCGVPGLESLLVDAGLESYVADVSRWCDEQGARFLEELTDEETFNELVEELQLKPLEKKRLKKALAASVPGCSLSSPAPSATAAVASAAGAGGYAGTAQPPVAAQAAAAMAAMGAKPQQSVFVKNTFLDLDDLSSDRQSALMRASTCPAPSAGEMADDGDEDDDEEEEEASPAGVAPQQDAHGEANPLPGLYKTVTCDGYEPYDQWAWVGGDPNAASASAAASLSAVDEHASATAPLDASDGGSGGYCMDESSWAAAQGSYTSAEQGMMGVIMVPAPEGMYPMAAGAWGMQPGCVVVPMMDRFVRWPQHAEAEPAAPEKEHTKKNVLQRAFSVASSIYRVRWTVDARKLKSKDTEAVSPAFELSIEGNVAFKMLLRPRVTSDTKGGASFKKARGRGIVELRCLDEVDPDRTPTVTFRISIGSPADPAKQQLPRGPVKHDFTQKSIVGLPRGEDEWNFSQVVDKASQTFVVCLEVLTGPASPP